MNLCAQCSICSCAMAHQLGSIHTMPFYSLVLSAFLRFTENVLCFSKILLATSFLYGNNSSYISCHWFINKLLFLLLFAYLNKSKMKVNSSDKIANQPFDKLLHCCCSPYTAKLSQMANSKISENRGTRRQTKAKPKMGNSRGELCGKCQVIYMTKWQMAIW